MDETHPHALLRVRVHGNVLAAQPYSSDQRYGRPLLIDLQKGTIALGEKMLNFEKDYLVAHAILGVQRLRTCVAVPVVTTAQAMATVGGHTIYKVKGTQVLTANGRAPEDKLDARLLVHLKDAVDSIGCGAGLHFCTTRNLSCSLQRGAAADLNTPLWQRSDSEMWFNAVLSEPLCHAGAHQYIMPCILGFVRQLQKLRMKAGVRETEVTVTLIARRSRYRVGTRHWRRGVDNQGFVANFVESEQIVEAGTGEIASFVQVRGSIPVPWSHVPNGKYKPPTAIGDAERHCRAPFNAHAAHLGKRYGAVTAINLVNQHGSEGRLSAAFDALVQGLPTNMPFQLATFDFHKECGKASYENLSKLWDMVAPTFEQHGAYRTKDEGGVGGRTQQMGVMRTNCVDCLDRTNVVQSLLARRALEAELRSLLLLDRNQSVDAAFPELERRFRILWADHGDMCSIQYAGTGALKAGVTRTGKRTPMGYVDDGLKSAVRYFLNNFEDGHKQDSYDLVTGTFRPREVKAEGDVTPPSPSAAFWVLGALFFAFVGLSLVILAPLSRRIHFVSHALPFLVLGGGLFGAVIALGVKATCRPALRPDLVQPWLPPPGKAPPQSAVKKKA